MKLETILEMWEKDSVIDPEELNDASKRTSELHAKYLGYYAQAKLEKKFVEFEQKKLMKKKWLWYNGKMSEEELKKQGWDPDPFDGLKILKGDMQHYVEADPELIESEQKIEYKTTVLDTLKEILDVLKWRHQTIRNIIENKKFEAGF